MVRAEEGVCMRFKNTVKARRQRSGHGEGVATAGPEEAEQI